MTEPLEEVLERIAELEAVIAKGAKELRNWNNADRRRIERAQDALDTAPESVLSEMLATAFDEGARTYQLHVAQKLLALLPQGIEVTNRYRTHTEQSEEVLEEESDGS